jgi:parallel beta-helix repeat protein
MKKTLLNIFISISLTNIICGQTLISNKIVSGSWKKENSPFIINCNILVEANNSLIIENGVKVIFNGQYNFIIEGQLKANGLKGDSVIFTSINSNTRWQGLKFNNTTNSALSSNLTFCTIENSGSKTGEGSNTSFSIEYGGGLYISGSAPLAVSNCLIRYNMASNGGAIYNNNNLVKIINSKLDQNQAWIGGALFSKRNTTLKGCLISNNISYTSYGCFASSLDVTTTFINNTITKNINTEHWGGVFCINGDLNLINTIIFSNFPNNNYISSSGHDINIRYCDIEGGIDNFKSDFSNIRLTYVTNYSFNPTFVDLARNDFHIINSSCINHGDPQFYDSELNLDLDGNPRKFSNDPIDIGAYEYQGAVTNFSPVIYSIEEKYLLKNSSCKIPIYYFDADEKDTHTIELFTKNPNLKASVQETLNSGFLCRIVPEKKWAGDTYLIIKIKDNSNENNAVCIDSVQIHVGNRFKGLIDSSETFEDTIKIIGDVKVDRTGTLSIKEGAYIEFQDYFKFSVVGKLRAYGSMRKPIFFNSVDTLIKYYSGGLVENGWGGLDFINSTDTIEMVYCNIFNTGVKQDYSGTSSNGTINIINSKNIILNHCVFNSNYSGHEKENCGVFLDSSKNVLITNCSFSNAYNYNNNGGYIHALYSEVTIDSCKFSNSHFFGSWGLIYYPNSKMVIKNSSFNNNFSYCLIRNIGGGKSLIENNQFKNNDAKGITINVSDTSIIRNNIFSKNKNAIETLSYAVIVGNIFAYNRLICHCSNFYGVAIDLLGTKSYIANNTFVGNYQDSNGDAIYASYSSPTVINNIFWKNKGSGFGWYNGDPVNGIDNPVITNNYSQDPVFVFSDSLDFNLRKESYCIDKGLQITQKYLYEKDIYGKPRIDTLRGKIDIGAVEFQGKLNESTYSVQKRVSEDLIYPNPARDLLFLKDSNLSAKYKIIDFNGICQQEGLIEGNSLDISNIPKGFYTILLQKNGTFKINKFIKQ